MGNINKVYLLDEILDFKEAKMKRRRLYKAERLDIDSEDRYDNHLKEVDNELEADLVGSKTFGKGSKNYHLPVIDFDFPCYIVESVDPDHGHLYIDHPLPWEDYKKLLETLLEIGLVQHGWYQNAIDDEQTFVRTEERCKHDRVHGKESTCYPGCLDEKGEVDPKSVKELDDLAF